MAWTMFVVFNSLCLTLRSHVRPHIHPSPNITSHRSPSQNSRAMSVNSAPAGAHSAGRGRGYGKSHIRARSANSDGGYSAQKRVGGAGAKSPYNMFGTFQRGGQQERGRGRSPPHAHPRSAIKPQSSPHKPHFMRNTTSSKQHYSGHSGRFQYDVR